MIARVLMILVALCGHAAASPLLLADVIRSVERSHPLQGAAESATERAQGQVLAARGAFDPRLRVRAHDTPVGYYDAFVVDSEVRAATTFQGISPYAGYRLGRGEFPEYDWKQRTLDGGELRVGIDIPLLRDREIDRARGDLARAQLGTKIAEADARQRRLDLQRDAAITYWEWVAAGHRLALRTSQADLARARGDALRQAVAAGNVAAVEQLDNDRVVAAREAQVVSARRDLGRAALALSLYMRTDAGAPILVGLERLPELPAEAVLDDNAVEAVVARATAAAPQDTALRTRIAMADVDIALARNLRLPSLMLGASAARGVGNPEADLPDRSTTAFGIGLTLEVPMGLRTARGMLASARAEQKRFALERQYLRERIANDVTTARLELATAIERARLARTQADLADQLAQAERDRFGRGDSTILVVNLREEAAADARAAMIDALTETMKASAYYRTLLGERPIAP